MKSLLFFALGITGLLSLSLTPSKPAEAQDAELAKLHRSVAGAPKGGIVMVQDAYDVYIYDGGAQKILVVSKTTSDENGKPTTKVINVAKLKE